MLWNITPKKVQVPKKLPEFKGKLKKHLIPCNNAACCFWCYRLYTYPNNYSVKSYIVTKVKLRFIIVIWIG